MKNLNPKKKEKKNLWEVLTKKGKGRSVNNKNTNRNITGKST